MTTLQIKELFYFLYRCIYTNLFITTITFEKLVPEIKLLGIDEVYCVSVNDSFVMNAWGKQLGVENVKLIDKCMETLQDF